MTEKIHRKDSLSKMDSMQLMQLVLHLADWCAYEQSGCADENAKNQIRAIRGAVQAVTQARTNSR